MEDLRYQIDLLKEKNVNLKKSESMYKLILEVSSDFYFYENIQEKNWTASSKFYTTFHMDEENPSFNKSFLLEQIHEDDRDKIVNAIEEYKETPDNKEFEFQMAFERVWYKCTMQRNYDKNHNLIERIFCCKDITDIKRKNDELSYLAYYDSLTGLINRNYFVQRLASIIEEAKGNHDNIGVLYLDIDNFKKINDGYGILLGDEVIQSVGVLLRDMLPDDVLISRFTNDEFCIAVPFPYGNRSVINIYEQIKNKLRRPIRLSSGEDTCLTVSAGVSMYPDSGKKALELIKNAEIVMFDVKNHGKNAMRFFEPKLLNQFLNNIKMEADLKAAIQNEEFSLVFQPQYEIRTNQPRGAEALIRWQRADGTYTSPLEFIALAERTGCIVEIGNWVMEEAIRTYASWKNNFNYPGVISINISAVQLKDRRFVPNLLNLIDKYKVDPHNIELEITESVLITDLIEVVSKIKDIRNKGIRFSLDDFGTGYSSLSYLKELPIDTLKIDKSFINDALTDKCTNIITSAVIEMVQKLGLETIAEGVETEEQYEYLKKIKCDNIQGFLLGKPMTKQEFEKSVVRINIA